MPKLEALRDEWLAAEDKPTQLALARKIQEQALQDVPYLPLGSYYQPVAYKANLTGVPEGPYSVHRSEAHLTGGGDA